MFSPSLAAHADIPRSGYRGSDFVLWHWSENLASATTSAAFQGQETCGERRCDACP
jgi:hypothetical protein